MKNLKIFTLLFLSTLLFSCGDDDDVSTDNNTLNIENLAGTYVLTAASGTGTTTETTGGTTAMGTSTYEGSNFNNCTLSFTAAGAISTAGEYTLTEMYTEDGMTDTDSFVTDLTDLGNTFTLNGNTIVFPALADPDITSNYMIGSFTNSGFVLLFTINENDTNETSETEGRFTFVRQ